MHIRGYELGDELLRTGPYVVRRGRRLLDKAPVLLKMAAADRKRGNGRRALERELELLRQFFVPAIPRPYELAGDPSTPCLVLEDCGLPPLRQLIRERQLDLWSSVRLAISLAAALQQLHRHRVICGGLSPFGILADPASGRVQLIDFTCTTRMNESRDAILPSDSPAAYASPEQTGRVNRSIDHRSDLYALGATMYELLTGSPPFRADDPLELIHSHIARIPQVPSERVPAIPEAVSRIVMCLLSKAPEDRYQSAIGLIHDLEECERRSSAIEPFALRQRDCCERFMLPGRIYGRDEDVPALTGAFDEACTGGSRLLLVSGYSGVGKTSLITELYHPIVRERSYFVSGKFDQVARCVPYGAIVQAFRGLVWQMLAESEDRLARWRSRLAAAVGANAGVLVDVIPEMKFILGEQPPPPPLDAAETQNRFRLVFQSFVGTIGQPQHPLVLFLDDLQWADAATLNLLHTLLTASDVRHCLVLGAFRANEIGTGHLLPAAIDRLEREGAHVHHLPLAPLTRAHVIEFLADALRVERAEVEPLADVMLRKTDGNPFFMTQFLHAAQQQGLFRFDAKRGGWSYRLEAIASANITDNVVDLMTRRIRALSPGAQRVLTLAACLGSEFEESTLLTVSRAAPEEIRMGLAEAIESGLIQPAAGVGFAFLHDRVQQAAYELISREQRLPVHLDAGRLLLARYRGEAPDDRLFEIVNHLNIGKALVEDPAEALTIAKLNLAAGRKAKLSAAYKAASLYVEEGLALARQAGVPGEQSLVFGLQLEAAECRYLAGDFGIAEQHFDALLADAGSLMEKAQVHSLRIVLYENLSRFGEAVASGRAGLALFNVVLPSDPSEIEAALEEEIAHITALRGARSIASLVDLPVLTVSETRMVLRILTSLWAAAYLSEGPPLARLISATMVRLSLAFGNGEDSAYGYVTHAITVGPVRRDYASAYEWGQLALSVNERFGDRRQRAKIHQQFNAHVTLWRRPFETCIAHAREARRTGLECGDFTYAGYAAVTESWPALLTNRDLDRFIREHWPTLALLDRIRMPDFRAALQVMLNWARALQGRTAGAASLSDGSFDEEAFLRQYRDSAFFLTFFYAARLHLLLLLGRWHEAVEAGRRARAVSVTGTIWPVAIDFWASLALAGASSDAGGARRGEALAEIRRVQETLACLADNSPQNFRCWHLLVAAEAQRLDGQLDAALTLAGEAASYARRTDRLQEEALAAEACARIHLARDDRARAADALCDARAAYIAWGAAAKVAQLEERYGDLEVPAAPPMPGEAAVEPATTAELASLDLATVLKMARAIGGEIELDELLRKVIGIAIENAGAERGLFFHERDGTLTIEAEADAAGVQERRQQPWDQVTHFAHSVVRYVRRTNHDLVVGDASSDERFAVDPYIVRAGVKSILCVPIGHQGRPGGILYLENNLTTEAFTPSRIEMMRVLASQAAISLENARLYDAMKQEVARRTTAEESLRDALREVEGLKNRLEAENVYLQEEIRTQHNFNEIVGNSAALLRALKNVELVAPTDSTVLILGETGCGKELFARAIHSRSHRNARPLVKVNCGGIAPGLVESELFGHVKGAFTGAIEKRIGRFEVANGGTIFLDEIGELPIEAQVKLLRVLQEQEFEPVGSSRTVRVNVRVIAATNRNLDEAVREGRFRADLLYRLNVFPIQIPALRERRGDIPLLVTLFLSMLARKLRKPLSGVTGRSMEKLIAYPWPGNVRELQNIVERAAILARGAIIEVDDAFLGAAPPALTGPAPAAAAAEPAERSGSAETLDAVQRAHIIEVLQRTGGVLEGARGAAKILGLHPNTLRSRMKKLGIVVSRTA